MRKQIPVVALTRQQERQSENRGTSTGVRRFHELLGHRSTPVKTDAGPRATPVTGRPVGGCGRKHECPVVAGTCRR